MGHFPQKMLRRQGGSSKLEMQHPSFSPATLFASVVLVGFVMTDFQNLLEGMVFLGKSTHLHVHEM